MKMLFNIYLRKIGRSADIGSIVNDHPPVKQNIIVM